MPTGSTITTSSVIEPDHAKCCVDPLSPSQICAPRGRQRGCFGRAWPVPSELTINRRTPSADTTPNTGFRVRRRSADSYSAVRDDEGDVVLGRRQAVLTAATVAIVLSGGTAWAASGGLTTGTHVHATDVTDLSTSSTDSTDTTVDPASTSTSTDTTDTTIADTSTTTTLESTTTVPVTTTTVLVTTTSTPQPCKPGWGYGDKNHCHSGPPGQQNHHHGQSNH